MPPTHTLNRRLYRLGLLTLQCGWVAILALPTLANEASPTGTSSAQSGISALVFNQSNSSGGFEGQGRPLRRTSGGSRGNCDDQLIALVPGLDTVVVADTATETTDCSVASVAEQTTTLQAMPTLWFHIPPQPDTGVVAELALLDDNAQALAVETITLPAESGIIGIQLSYPLVAGQPYQWVFSMVKHPNSPSQNPTVEGRVQRLMPDSALTNALNAAQDPQTKAQVFAQYGIWHDALEAIAQWQHLEPENSAATQSWVSLLGSVGLEAISQAPLLTSPTVSNSPLAN